MYVLVIEISEGEDERREGVLDEGELSGGMGVIGRFLGCSGLLIIYVWKIVFSEGEGEIIYLLKLEDGMFYWGVNKGENLYSVDGYEVCLCEGVYFIDDFDEVIDFVMLW